MVNTPGPRPPNQVLINTAKNGMVAPLRPIAGTRSSDAVDQIDGRHGDPVSQRPVVRSHHHGISAAVRMREPKSMAATPPSKGGTIDHGRSHQTGLLIPCFA